MYSCVYVDVSRIGRHRRTRIHQIMLPRFIVASAVSASTSCFCLSSRPFPLESQGHGRVACGLGILLTPIWMGPSSFFVVLASSPSRGYRSSAFFCPRDLRVDCIGYCDALSACLSVLIPVCVHLALSLCLCQYYLSVCLSLCAPTGVSILFFLSPTLLDCASSTPVHPLIYWPDTYHPSTMWCQQRSPLTNLLTNAAPTPCPVSPKNRGSL